MLYQQATGDYYYINHKLAGLLPPKAEHHRQLRSNRKFYVPVCKTDRFKKSFIVSHSLRM